jgi:hypothetical protein
MKISYSKFDLYMRCQYAHHLSYVECLRKKGAERPLFFGGNMHKLLQFRHKPKALKRAKLEIDKAYNALSNRDIDAVGQGYLQDLYTVFGDYQQVWKDVERPIETEHEIKFKIGKFRGEPVIFHGIIDELYEGQIIGEHKTFSTAPKMSILAMNTQVCLYSKARELETGEKIKRVRWDYIKSAPAAEPIWLPKSNRFSEATNGNITPMSWLRACDARGIVDQETRAKALNYEQNISNHFFKAEFDIVPEMVDTVWEDFKRVCKDIIVNEGTNKTKHISRDCDWCGYRPICFAEFTGADVEYVKKTDYIVKERS